MIVRGYEVAGQPNSALVYLHEVVQLNRDSRVRNVLQQLQHSRHLPLGEQIDLQVQMTTFIGPARESVLAGGDEQRQEDRLERDRHRQERK